MGNNIPQPTHECKKMSITMIGTGSCDERRSTRDFSRGGEPHLECQGCPGPEPIKQPPPTGPVKSEEKEIAALAKAIRPAPAHPAEKNADSGLRNAELKPANSSQQPPIKTTRTCSYDGCDKKLRHYNSSGHCRKHAQYAPKYKPTPAPCKTPDCGNMTKGYGTTGLCKSCTCKENAKKPRSPDSEKKRIATLKANKAKKKADSPIKDCGMLNADLKPATPKRRNQQPATSNPKPDISLTLDFTKYPEILKALRAEAEEEFRDIHQQALFILNHHLKWYFDDAGPEGDKQCAN